MTAGRAHQAEWTVGAEAGVWLRHLRNSKEAARPRTQLKGNGMGTREDVREENGKKRDTERCRG